MKSDLRNFRRIEINFLNFENLKYSKVWFMILIVIKHSGILLSSSLYMPQVPILCYYQETQQQRALQQLASADRQSLLEEISSLRSRLSHSQDTEQQRLRTWREESQRLEGQHKHREGMLRQQGRTLDSTVDPLFYSPTF